MAEELIQSKTIITTRDVFPPYLNFDKLRTEGIEYLGKLSGKIWTDHNVHDPGITILDILCYALLDLGYRTNLPPVDLFTPDPESESQQNFFTPACILSNNPLTITDFRKMLIDIPGVINAWLEVKEDYDVETYCTGKTIVPCKQDDPGQKKIQYLNGLYDIYVELEDPVAESKEEFEDRVIKEIKNALMAHRNICEDFASVKILCTENIGLCADIEIQKGADPEKIFLAIFDAIEEFISPLPKYYTLEALLVEKKKNIEQIFAGRPYNVKKGHGFVDTDEFEQLEMRKEIHLSDLYGVLNKVQGVVRVNKLKFNKCSNALGKADTWHYYLPKDHIPRFDIKCSIITFSSQNIPVAFDAKRFEELLSFNFRNNGKIFYDKSIPYLDTEIPKGIYRSELKQYISIQNEFPKVYGITEGGLPEKVSLRRKAQAIQLKGYLFFFDQLLADYVAQLQNMNALFSSTAMETTYSSGLPVSTSAMQELLRYNSEARESILGMAGGLLAIPVDREKIDALIEKGEIHKLELEKIKPFNFSTKTDCEIAISQLKQDIQLEDYSARVITKKDGCVFYYILTSSDDIALIGKKYFSNEKQAKAISDALKYAGSFNENYKIYNSYDQQFSFGVEMNLAVYPKYLKNITEDKELFYKRRKSFLDHLLLRFAEQFTDFALKSYIECNCKESKNNGIEVREAVLSNYDELSANRGKAYDYFKNKWNNDNVSGFEKRFKALAGIKDWGKHYLSHFEVDEHPTEYIFSLNLGGQKYFISEEKFSSKEEAAKALQSLFNALSDDKSYQTGSIPHKEGVGIRVKYDEGKRVSGFIFNDRAYTPDGARHVIDHLAGLFSEKELKNLESDPESTIVFESGYKYLAVIKKSGEDKAYYEYHQPFNTKQEAAENAIKDISSLTDTAIWKQKLGTKKNAESLLHGPVSQFPIHFVDNNFFKFDPSNHQQDKPKVHGYTLLESEHHSFTFKPIPEFESKEAAEVHANELKTLLLDEKNYQVLLSDDKKSASIQINKGEEAYATSEPYLVTKDEKSEIKRIRKIISAHEYIADIDDKADAWDFSYKLGFEKDKGYVFKTQQKFANKSLAIKKAKQFYAHPEKIKVTDQPLQDGLVYKSGGESLAVRYSDEVNGPPAPDKVSLESLLSIRSAIRKYQANNRPESFMDLVKPDPISEQGTFYYRLVNKDELCAFYRDKNLSGEVVKKLSLAIAIDTFNKGYNYLEIDRKAENFLKRKDECKKYWYHYRLKSINPIKRPGYKNEEKQLILFEGVRGYVSKEEAQKRFADDWRDLLHEAMERISYGEGELISLREILIQEKNADKIDKTKVFIPLDTLKWLGETEEKAIEEMIKLAKSYPVRYLTLEKDRDEFEKRFPCAEKSGMHLPPLCKTTDEKKIYYFVLYNREKGIEDWQSNKFYDTADKAHKAFTHFYFLLRYKGNFHVDCDCNGDYRLFVREVLAVSNRRFTSREAAWGNDGVEKFICVAQSCDSFHHYLSDECCHSFDVACGKIPFYHPCKYDTPQTRDHALDKLCRFWKDFISKDPFKIYQDAGKLRLKDLNGDFIAFIFIDPVRTADYDYCDLISFIEAINLGNFDEKTRTLRYKNKKIAEPVNLEIPFDQWKYSLIELAWYFPIIKETEEDSFKYCIEIRVPGFNIYRNADHLAENQLPDDLEASTCWLAWKSECCFDSCELATDELKKLIPVLSDCSNYRSVYDCLCGPFGIDLLNRKAENSDPNGIIAFNPQCYFSMEMSCEASELTRSLTNNEGLHLVEHILLRPHCPELCECRLRPAVPCQFDGCDFQWDQDKNDPCKKDKSICFVPGYDPYSFIATVVLPAWPDRFRTAGNRLLIEDQLRREAPAHLLLRILWLKPQDFDRFETYFKQWNHWLTGQKKCTSGFSICDFLNFLFRSDFEPLSDCDICQCKKTAPPQLPDCFADDAQTDPCDDISFADQLKSLFRWRTETFVTGSAYTSDEITTKISDRYHKYRRSTEELAHKKGVANDVKVLPEKVLSIMKKQFVPKERFVELMKEVTNEKSRELLSKGYTNEEIKTLTQLPILYYLDTVTLNKAQYPQLKYELKEAIYELKKRIPDGKNIYEEWNPQESKRINPEIDHREIECWLTGTNTK